MGKAATIAHKSKKTPVLLYRTFLKLSIASIIYACFKILNGTPISKSALAITVAIAGAIAYELAYFIYKSNSKPIKGDTTRGQIFVLSKLVIFFGGVFMVVYGSSFVHSGKPVGALLVIGGLIFCQQIHNNTKIFSHLSTFSENAAAGFVVITMELIFLKTEYDGKNNTWAISAAICIALFALTEIFFHFYNVKKHKGDKLPMKKLLVNRAEQFWRNSLVVIIIWLMWTLLTLTGSVQAMVESGLYDQITNLLPIGISVITASASIYLEFIKKPKEELLSFNPQIGKGEFAEQLIKKFGKENKAVKALDYVTEKMNKATGYTRYSGEDYYVHPIAVAKILMDNTDADESVIAAALLHDCVEDLPECTYELILKEYGHDIANTVLLVTKKKDVDYSQRENMREYLDAISLDRSATLVKVADRMNNNSTMANRDEDKKAAKTDETKALYVPLAEGAAKNDPKNAAFYTTAVKFFKQEIR